MENDIMNIFVSLARIEERVTAIDKRINGSISSIEKHIEEGSKWRIFIASVAAGLIVQTLILASMWGRLCKTVDFNSERIKNIETKYV